MKIKAVIMDLGNTVVDNLDFRFEEGLRYLQSEVISNVTIEELIKINSELKKDTYDIRSKTNLEIRFLNYLHYLKAYFGFSNRNIEEIECEFMIRASVDKPVKDIDLLLEYFKSQGIPIYILSNSTFSSNAITYQLERFHLAHYFEVIYSSSDYIFRKPHSALFSMALHAMMRNHPELNLGDIVFIGNDYHCDIQGAISAGIKPIWFNRNHEENTDGLDCICFDSYSDLVRSLIENNKNY